MNNLKRVLSLGLTGTMLTGMMAMGASAANFNDADKITHTDAVNTMVALGVLKGKDTGSYDPTGIVTRAEMAKIICVSLNGGEDPSLGVKATPTYSDIKGHWAESYIEYCTSIGVIAGQGDGTFAPDATVTGSAAAKMFLVALGYDSDVFGFTGMDWEINTNVQANNAKLYDELKGVNVSTGLTRDNAAQMAYNVMDAKIMDKTYDKVQSNGQISYNYTLSDTTTFLNKYFDAYTFVGTYTGNYDTGAASNDGEIEVTGKLDTAASSAANVAASLPSDLDISNIGEEIKVIFKDGKGGLSSQPDKKDTIYGVFNTGSTVVYNDILANVKNGSDAATSASKIKVGSTEYKIATPAAGDTLVVRNYDDAQKTVAAGANATALLANAKATFEALKNTNDGSTVKFVTNDNGEIKSAYVVDLAISYVTAVNSEKVTLNGVGSIKIADNNLYEGIAKNDIVTYTKYYDTDKDDATFTVAKAEAVSGELTSYKNAESMVVAGTTYKTQYKALKSATTIGDDTTVASLEEGDIGEDFTAYLVGGYVGYLIQKSDGQNQYALVTDRNTGKLDSTFDTPKAQLLLADGTKVTAQIHKDSVIKAGANYANDGDAVVAGEPIDTDLEIGQIVKYAVVSDGLYKITEVGTYNNAVAENATVYVKDTKAFMDTVTAGDCPLFVNENGTYKVYSIRNLNDVKTPTDPDSVATYSVGSYVKDGKVVAAFAEIAGRPSGASSNMYYGIVSGSNGTVKVDDDYYNSYTVENAAETLKVLLPNSGSNAGTLTAGQLVGFDRSSDDVYNNSDIERYEGTDYDDATTGMAAWVKEYNAADKTLTYYEDITGTTAAGFTGGTAKTVALDDDCVIAYVNADDQEAGDDVGISAFDGVTGYRNILLVKDSSTAKVVGILVESSGDADIIGNTLTLGAQDGVFSSANAESVTFELTSNDPASFSNATAAVTLHFYTSSAGTTATTAPANLTVPATVNFNASGVATLTMAEAAGTTIAAGNYYFTVTFNGVTSAVATLAVAA